MARIVIQREDILENYRLLSAQTPVIPVLKANGYGLGAEPLFALLKEEGVSLMAVSRLEEALPLCGQGVELLVLSCNRSQNYADIVLEKDLTTALDTLEFAQLLSEKALAAGKKARVHLKVDTGMGRFGFLPVQMDEILAVFELPGLEVTGIFTHCYGAFLKDGSAEKQLATFQALLEELRARGIELPLRHIANSSASQLGRDFALDALRIGSALTGRLPLKTNLPLKKVGRFEGEILAIRQLPKGSNIGYGNVCKLKKDTRVAVVSAGTADGLLRTTEQTLFRPVDLYRYLYHDLKLFFKKPVVIGMVNGCRAKMLGRPATTHSFFDVTDIPCQAGDYMILDVPPLRVDASVERIYE